MPVANLAKRLLVLAGLAAVVVVWVFVARTLMHPVRVTQTPGAIRPTAIVWGDRTFASRAALASWLASHGVTYRQWAKLHRADAAIVEHVRTPARGILRPPSVQAPRASSASGISAAWARAVLLVLAVMVMLTAVAPEGLVRLAGGGRFGTTWRAYMFTVGLSVCIGVLLAGGGNL
jgi:hypothetical protein